MHLPARKQQFFIHLQYLLCVCVCVDSPVSLQLSAVLSEGRPQVPGVPRGVVAHSSGSRNHDAFCRHTQKKLEVERWNGTRSLEACGHYSDTQRRQLERRKCRRVGLSHCARFVASSHLLRQTGAGSGEVLHVRLGAALPLIQDEVCGHFTLQTGDVAMTEVVAQVVHLRGQIHICQHSLFHHCFPVWSIPGTILTPTFSSSSRWKRRTCMAWIICREVDEYYELQNIPWCIKKVSFDISVIFREHHTKLSSSGLDENMGFSERIWKTKWSGCCKSKY